MRLRINIKKLHPDAIIPSYSVEGDAGMDLTAVSQKFDDYGNVVYYTGLSMEIPKGYVGLIFPRSSVSKYNLLLANSVGVIDSGYRGEIICKFKTIDLTDTVVGNLFKAANEIKQPLYNVGERVAQIMIIPRPEISFIEVDELSASERGEGGFGSTGK